MTTSHPFPATIADVRRALNGAYDTVRTHARRVGTMATRTFDRVGAAAESYVGEKVKRRVKPPIVVALVAAGVALIVAIVAVLRK
jgi:hypothetical protein